ncbi:MAG TPA: hypothetical protein VKX49_30075 [Bryobacteraceae bacterium]|nr:hypothetical protein [Bryobacteraceae bacterium]
MASKLRPAALGCRSHSGWAAVVGLGGSLKNPEVLDRRRVELADAAIRGSKQPYHFAEPMKVPDAEAFLERCTKSTAALAIAALQGAIGDLERRGYAAVVFGITLASGRALPELKAILASHALIHTAEGEFYREQLRSAARRSGLAVSEMRERELYDRASARLGIARAELEHRVAELGKKVGPPWSQDQKCAALAAWLALAGMQSGGHASGRQSA